MVGLQELIIKNNIKVYDLARELNCHPSCIYDWFRNEKIPRNRLKILAEILQVDEVYLNKKVNDFNTYKPKEQGFKNKYKINGDVTYIYLQKRDGEILQTSIDTEDLKIIQELDIPWHLRWNPHTQSYYVMSGMYMEHNEEKGRRNCKTLYLQRIIMNAQEGDVVDHINHNTLDNRKGNLRLISKIENEKHRKGRNSNNKSGYRNVSRRNNWWVVQLSIDGKNTTLKKFPIDQLEEAGKYAEEMRRKFYGEFAGEN